MVTSKEATKPTWVTYKVAPETWGGRASTGFAPGSACERLGLRDLRLDGESHEGEEWEGPLRCMANPCMRGWSKGGGIPEGFLSNPKETWKRRRFEEWEGPGKLPFFSILSRDPNICLGKHQNSRLETAIGVGNQAEKDQ